MSSLGKKRKKKRQVTFLHTKKEVTKRDKVFSNQRLRIKHSTIPWDMMKLLEKIQSLSQKIVLVITIRFQKPLHLIDNEVEKKKIKRFYTTLPDICFIASWKDVSGIRTKSNTKHALHSSCVIHLPKDETSVQLQQSGLFKNNQFYDQPYPPHNPLENA